MCVLMDCVCVFFPNLTVELRFPCHHRLDARPLYILHTTETAGTGAGGLLSAARSHHAVCSDGAVGRAPGGGAADAHVADALEAAAAGADACSPSLKGDKGGKRADRQPEQERQPEKASGSDGIEPGTLGKGWTMVSVKPAYLALLLLLQLLRC